MSIDLINEISPREVFLELVIKNVIISVFQFLQTFQDRCSLLHTNGIGILELLQVCQILLEAVGIHLRALLDLDLMGVVVELRNQAYARNQSSSQ